MPLFPCLPFALLKKTVQTAASYALPARWLLTLNCFVRTHGSWNLAQLRHAFRVGNQCSPGLWSGYRLWDVAEKFNLSPDSEHSSSSKMAAYIEGRHLQLKEQLWLAESFFFFKMSHRSCHLQLKEQFSLAEPSTILDEPFASYLKVEMHWRQTLNANWAKNRCRISEGYPEHSPVCWVGADSTCLLALCLPRCLLPRLCSVHTSGYNTGNCLL